MRTIYAAALSALVTMSASAQAPKRIKAELPAAAAANVQPEESKEAKVQPQASKRFRAQQEAMKELAFLDGEWRGTSKVLRKDGWTPMVQTQRTGTMLDGSVRMIEGKGYEADGRLNFNVLRIISYEPDTRTYSMRSYQSGRVRDHEVTPTEDGFAWEVESSREMTIRYEASVKNGVWMETATRVPADGEPETYVELKMKRQRTSGWAESAMPGAKPGAK